MPSKDCGCGRGKARCISRGSVVKEQKVPSETRISEQRVKELLDEFLKSHKGKTTVTAMKKFIEKKLKVGDCGCGCKGGKALLKGGVLKDCPPGYRNDGLTCVENCKEGEVDDGLTCRDAKCPPGFYNTGLTCQKDPKTHVDPCPSGYRDDGVTCFRDARCWQTGDAWRPVWDPNHQRTHCAGPDLITAAQRNHRYEGPETRGHPIRSKRIEGRVDWEATQKQLEKGFEDAFGQNGALAKAFDPEKNGVGSAFRKFGADTEAAFNDIGEKMRKAFDPANMRKAFEEFGKMLESTLGNADWWKDTMGNPDTWIMILGVLASVAATVLSAGTLGPAAFIALQMVGPAAKMIGDAAQGRPVDGLDFLAIAFAMIPGAGPAAGAASNAASKAIIEGVKLGATAAKLLPHAQKAVQLGKIVVSGVKVAQAIGVVPTTCIANCPDLTPEKVDNAAIAAELAAAANMKWDSDDENDDWGIAGMDDENLDFPEEEPESLLTQEEIHKQLEDEREPLFTPEEEVVREYPADEADRIIQEIESEVPQKHTKTYLEHEKEKFDDTYDISYGTYSSLPCARRRELDKIHPGILDQFKHIRALEKVGESSGAGKKIRRKK